MLYNLPLHMITSRYVPQFLLSALLILVLFAPEAAFAQEAGSVGQLGFGALIARMMPMLFMIFFVFYFMVVRPQQSKMVKQKKLLDELKRGEMVVTTSGIVGKVSSIDDTFVTLDLGGSAKVKFLRDFIVDRHVVEVQVVS